MKVQLENQMEVFKTTVIVVFVMFVQTYTCPAPVGFHQDVFGKGDSSKLENRRVFYNYGRDGSNGRGGFRVGTFAYAILDW